MTELVFCKFFEPYLEIFGLMFWTLVGIKLIQYFCIYFSSKPRIYLMSIDGNIGSGKSTLIKLLKQKYGDSVHFAKEPVDTWKNLKDENGKDILTHFYENKNRWGYTFQNLAFITRKMELDKAFNSGAKLIITERSVDTDFKVFAKMLYEQKDISDIEMNIYLYWFNSYRYPIDFQVYLHTDVANCLTRIKKRDREGEESIDQRYLEKLHHKHDNWLLGDKNTLILDGNQDFVTNKRVLKKMIKQIERFISKRK